MPVEKLEQKLRTASSSCTSYEMGLAVNVHRETICHGHEMPNCFSFADIADSARVLKNITAKEA